MHTTTSSPPCRVAICDDVADFRQLLTLMLSRAHDLEVIGEASNGIEVIELVRAQAPDVLLLDVAMPVMDGLAALPRVHEVSPKTRVILLTGFGSGEGSSGSPSSRGCSVSREGSPSRRGRRGYSERVELLSLERQPAQPSRRSVVTISLILAMMPFAEANAASRCLDRFCSSWVSR